MASTYDYYGWDLLYKTVCNRIEDETDIVVALAHWFLTKYSLFRCVGVGDDKTLSPDEVGSELLPAGWNDCHDKFALKYRYDNDVYILLAARTENAVVLNLLDSKSRNVSNLAVNPKEVVKSRIGPLPTMIPTVNVILDRMRRELVEPVFAGVKKEMETQTDSKRGNSSSPPRRDRFAADARSINDPLAIPRSLSVENTRRDPLRDIGRGDLDPLGRGGGGMIFTPPNMPFGPPGGGLNPRLGRPPGARFDPFGPVNPNRPPNNFGPNPDVFRPPPDYDDMYM